MLDREKIESLKQCLSASCRGFRTCPYNDTEWDAIKTVLELLAEQEAVPPVEEWFWYDCYKCGSCGELWGKKTDMERWNFCPWCGRAVKWDE